jgi:hypothetical protein
MKDLSRRQFVSTAAAAAAAALVPGSAFAQDPVLNTFQKAARKPTREPVPWKVLPFPMKQVRLLDGPCKDAQEANRRYLHSLPADRLLHTFRLTAGIPSSAEPLGGWEKPDVELRGHFTGGHYLSGCALAYASTGDEELKKKADAMVAELWKCQQTFKNGYLSAFPIEFFDRLRDRVKVWAPFYTIHKIMAGHLDMFVHCGNEQALAVAEGMAGWTASFTGPLSEQHMQRVLGTEFGGMAEVLANLYAVTGKREYLGQARRFEKRAFLDPLLAHRDELKGLHVNTHIPQVIGAARQYEMTRDTRYRDIAQYFWDEVVGERSYVNGGTSNGESWNSDPGKLADQLGPSTAEDCCAYNMMKLTRHLFGWSADPRLMDYYERTLLNHRLGAINPEDGMTMYYYPLGTGFWKTFGKPLDAFWCCTGTGVEEFAKLNDTIYFHDDDGIYVNLFIASELDWPEKGVTLRQETTLPEQESTTLTVQAPKPVEIALHIRIPYWVARGGKVKLNGQVLPAFSSPSSYLTLNRVWKSGDKVEISLPMDLHVHPMPDDETIRAMMYGPAVLAGKLEPVTPEMMYGQLGPRGKPTVVPAITIDPNQPTSWLEPVPNQPLAFRALAQPQPIPVVPLNKILRDKYVVYWKVENKRA